MATVSVYDHTVKRFLEGSNSASDTYKLLLASSATFTPANATLASISKTELSNANGYTTGGATLTSVTFTQSGNDAAFDANDVSFTASGIGLEASYAILYNDTDANDPPLLFIDFNGSVSIASGNTFTIRWSTSGIFTFTVN